MTRDSIPARSVGPNRSSGRRTRSVPTAGRQRPWPRISWWYSAILILPLLAIGWLVFDSAFNDNRATRRVSWQVAGADGPVAGARVAAGSVVATTNAAGVVTLDADLVGTAAVLIEADGRYPVEVTLPAAGSTIPAITMRSSSVSGTVVDAATGQALAGAVIAVEGTVLSATSAADGRFALTDVPEGTTFSVTADGYAVVSGATVGAATLDVALTYARLTGTVVDAAGEPVGNAMIRAGDAIGASREDGTFLIDGVAGLTEVTVSASGFRDATVPVVGGVAAPVALERVVIKATYINQSGLSDPETIDEMIAIINATELNAIVLDIKQDTIYFDSQVQFFLDVPGMVNPIYDPAALIERLHAEGIYVIARLVCFQDPLVAEHYPEYAVRDEVTGGSWRNDDGVAWVNAFNEPLWDANIALALEAVALGFDEIQYDYVRFPSDGNLRTADFGPDYSQEAREGAITGFIARSAEAIRPTGAKLAIDAFGIIGLWDDDQGIGQRLRQLAPLVDYLCLMIYPSHFELGNIDVPGHPNDFPGETITESLERAATIVPEYTDKFRPWLQDFTQPLPGFMEYGAAELREQIDAAEAFGGNGWLLWNPNNSPTVEALKPEE